LGNVQFVAFFEINAASFHVSDNCYREFISKNMIYSYMLESVL